MLMSYLESMTFEPMGSKHCNTDEVRRKKIYDDSEYCVLKKTKNLLRERFQNGYSD